MVSYLTTKGADVTLKALELGAIDFVSKPSTEEHDKVSLDNIKYELIQKIRVASEISALQKLHPHLKVRYRFRNQLHSRLIKH